MEMAFLKNSILNTKKIAIVHDWITNKGGAENVLMVLHEMFPNAPIFTSIFNEKKMSHFKDADIRTSFLQKFPFAKSRHQLFLSYFPRAFESFDLSEYDIVLSSSHSCAKGVITNLETMHVCYCYTPIRYAWDDSVKYINNSNFPSILKNWYIPKVVNKIRIWDKAAADRVDYYIAISELIRKRIKKYYRRESEVIYPPFDSSQFNISDKTENYFLAVGRLIQYKRFDLIIETFNKLGLPLKIAGSGPEYKKLKQLAKNNIEFLGFAPESELRTLYSKCQALIFPQVEDFGIIPIETMASGRPVIAFNSGGAKETVIAGKTGVLFNEQSVESLSDSIKKCLDISFNPEIIREHSLKFDVKIYKQKMVSFLEKKYPEWADTFL
jgi:glycosyltransferase involved in cell wall biosynthesis